MNTNYYIDVILPLALKDFFTYRVNAQEYAQIEQGMRVAVPFGNHAAYTAIVYEKHQNPPTLYKAKNIHAVLDSFPIITPKQLNFWIWIASYYQCSLGEVLKQALPSGFNLSTETIIKRNINWLELDETATEAESIIFEILQKQSAISIRELQEIIPKKKVFVVVKNLLDQALIQIEELIQTKYTPKIVQYVKLNIDFFKHPETLVTTFTALKRAPKQYEFLRYLFAKQYEKKPLKLTTLLKELNSTYAVVKALEHKNYIETYYLQTDRTYIEDAILKELPILSPAQNQAYNHINQQFKEKDIQLLQGVTGSGKTAIYLHLISKQLENQKQILILLPEIGLTNHLVQRIRQYFGQKVGLYHSKMNTQERVELWLKTFYNQYDIIIGARSAIFLPLSNLGLIIVDEEHEASFKQQDPNPRFHARDSAMIWAKQQNAKLLLGSATPSLESYRQALRAKYAYTVLTTRYQNFPLPQINLIDLKLAHKNKEINGSFSQEMIEAITETLAAKQQVIIFQNKRGYAPILTCLSCGNIPQCPNCDVSLNFHLHSHQLKCHYCGHTQAMIKRCLKCNSAKLNTKGIGIEQIEEELVKLFPKNTITRMDADSMRRKYAFEKLLQAFEAKEIDILIGTQMLAKGIDFKSVGLVGIVNADQLLYYPDFRASERAFQLITQVAGRAGRDLEHAKVLIQSYNPNHQILQQITTYDYELMAKELLYDRKVFKYPPYNRLIILNLKHKDKSKLSLVAGIVATQLKQSFGKNLLGPEEPNIPRIKNLYNLRILLKINKMEKLKLAKEHLQSVIQNIQQIPAYRSVQIQLIVDPY